MDNKMPKYLMKYSFNDKFAYSENNKIPKVLPEKLRSRTLEILLEFYNITFFYNLSIFTKMCLIPTVLELWQISEIPID